MNEKGDEIIELLEKILKWTKFQGKRKAKDILTSLLDDNKKKLIYHLSNGRSSPEIAEKAKVDPSTVRYYWRKWAAEGIVEIHPDYKKRYRRLFELKDFGIEVPEVVETSDEADEDE